MQVNDDRLLAGVYGLLLILDRGVHGSVTASAIVAQEDRVQQGRQHKMHKMEVHLGGSTLCHEPRTRLEFLSSSPCSMKVIAVHPVVVITRSSVPRRRRLGAAHPKVVVVQSRVEQQEEAAVSL